MIPDEDEDSNLQQESFNEYGAGGRVSTENKRESLKHVQIKPPLHQNLTGQIDEAIPYDNKGSRSQLDEVRIIGSSGLSNPKQRSFHSIDTSNIPGAEVKCLIMTDEPNIYEKKRQRFERIQKLRNGAETESGDQIQYEYGIPQTKTVD